MHSEATGGGMAVHRYPRLPYQSALDGLRALAVGGVLLYHHAPARFPGGWLGVSLFFTLSGFLIAGLALTEREATGRMDLLRFWGWRLRRLMPASVLALLLAAMVVVINDVAAVGDAAADIRAAAIHITNWHFIGADSPYAGVDAVPSPVQHFWSLAIEEQFYLLFPLLIVIGARRPRIVAPVLGVAIALGLTLQLTLGDLNRISYGSDTRAPELAVGVLLAMATPYLRAWFVTRNRLADVIGAGGLLALGTMFLTTHLNLGFLRSGALTAIPIVWCGLIVASVWGRALPWLLSAGPLPALGRLSFGIYLYHWPIYLVLTPARTGLHGVALLAVRLAVTVAIAIASASLVENPIRRRERSHRLTFALAGAGVATMILFTVMLPRVRPDATSLAAGGLQLPPEPVALPTTTAAPATAAPATTAPPTTTSDPTGVDPNDADPATPAPTPPPTVLSASTSSVPTTTVPVAERVPRLLVTGDSTSKATGTPMQQLAALDGVAEVYIRDMPGCTLLPVERVRLRQGYYHSPECPDLSAEIAKVVNRYDIDAIVIFVGSLQLTDFELDGMNGWHSLLETAVAERYNRAARETIDRVAELGVPILWADTPMTAWDLDAFGELFARPTPGVGEATSNDPQRVRALNRLDDAIARSRPNVERWAYASALAGPDGAIPPEARVDGLHVAPEYGAAIARDRLFPLLEDAYREVRSRGDASLDPADSTTWDVPR